MRCWIAAAMLLSCVPAGAAVKDGDESVRVVVYLDSSSAWFSGPLFSQAQAEASRLFLVEGIRLEWRAGRPPKNAAELPIAADVVAISFHLSTPTQLETPDKATALAIAQPYGKGPLPIIVFGDRVARLLARYHPNDSGKILGHILAHEIGHILEGVARHSDSGLMKARWNARDLNEIRGGGLGFAAQDKQLLRLRYDPDGGIEAP